MTTNSSQFGESFNLEKIELEIQKTKKADRFFTIQVRQEYQKKEDLYVSTNS